MNPLPTWLQNLRYTLRHPYVRLGLWSNSALTLVLVLLFALWWPVTRDHHTLTEAVDAKRRQMANALQAGDMLRAYRHAQIAVPRLEGKLRVGARQSEVVDHLGRLARQHDVRVVSQAFEDGKRRGDYLPLQINLTLQGRYDALRDLLEALPSLPVWTEIQELHLERSRESPGIVRAQLRLMTFRHGGPDRVADNGDTAGGWQVLLGKTDA